MNCNSNSSNAQKSLFDQYPQDLMVFLETRGEKKFRAKQLLNWIFEQRILDPDKMSNISLSLREALKESFSHALPQIVSKLDADDGATKLLLKTELGHQIETVILRYKNRVSLCVSSQVGCKLACSFCQTGKLGFFGTFPPRKSCHNL